jgi:hypothetical protein
MTAPFAPPMSFDADLLAEMRGWISDCVWDDLDDEVLASLSDRQVVNGIRRHYSGGVAQFMDDFYQFGAESGADGMPYYQ